MPQPFGHFLLNSVLPKEHHVKGTLMKKDIEAKMVALAREDAAKYADIALALKRLGDEVSTLEAVSVGLDDIKPLTKERDAILEAAERDLKTAKTPQRKAEILVAAQGKIYELTKKHPGSMTRMALSGARGNIVQLAKTVSSPVATTDAHGNIAPWLIRKSYAEGLSQADHWIAANQSRQETVSTYTAIAEPGDMTKIFVNNMYPLVISKEDCGTKNGLPMQADDPQLLDRYLARPAAGFPANTLVTREVAVKLKAKHETVYARSPLTCAAHNGVCQKCQGLDEKRRPHAIGVNVGVRAAQALSEPLTQMALGAKHGARSLQGGGAKLQGIQGIRQLLEAPESFLNKATLSQHTGVVQTVEKAPHGGVNVTVQGAKHYVPPGLKVTVHAGQHVHAGDVLSEGIPKPDELIHHKGFGAGRKYLIDTLDGIYRDAGVPVDKRHLELVARADLNHVRVAEHADSHPELLKGSTISLSALRAGAAHSLKKVKLKDAVGHALGEEVLHHTIGTPVTEQLVQEFRRHGITDVVIAEGLPKVEFLMRPITRNPLMNPDWAARLAHRYLKASLLDGARTGAESDLHSHHPVPAYMFGAEFGTGKDGAY